MIETKLADPMDVTIQYKHVIKFGRKVRIAWRTFADGTKPIASSEKKVKEAGSNVQTAQLHDAVMLLMLE